MKPGVKTSEFFVTIIAAIISVVMANLSPDQTGMIYGHIDKWVAIIGPILAAFGYTISRGLAKMNQPPK